MAAHVCSTLGFLISLTSSRTPIFIAIGTLVQKIQDLAILNTLLYATVRVYITGSNCSVNCEQGDDARGQLKKLYSEQGAQIVQLVQGDNQTENTCSTPVLVVSITTGDMEHWHGSQ